MRIAAYVQSLRTIGHVSGVGKHVGRMPVALAKSANLQLFCARDQLPPSGKLCAESPLAALSAVALPWRAKTIEWGGVLFRWPRIDKYLGSQDWLYCPAETPVATHLRLAVTAHTSDWAEPNLPWANELRYVRQRLRWKLIYRAIRRRGALVLAVSEFLRDRLIDRAGVNPCRIKVVGNGVEDEFFSADVDQLSPTIRALTPYALVIGGLSIYKGGDRILAVARILRTQNPDLRILVVGDSDAKMVSEAQSIGNIVLLGYVGVNTGLPSILAGAVALLFLSRYETFGIPFWEASAAGTPALIAPAGALAEAPAEFLVDPDRPAEIADQIGQLSRNSSARGEFTRRLRERAEKYRWDHVAKRVLAALAE